MRIRPIDVKNYLEPLYIYMQKLQVFVSRDELSELLDYFEVQRFEKKTVLLHQGEIDNYINLVVRGMIRKIITLPDRKVTLQIATEGHLIQSDISFNTRLPSEVSLETMESCIVIRCSYENMNIMLQKHPWTEKFGRQMVTQMALRKDIRFRNQLKTTPRQRFLNYVQDHPDMMNRVPQKILASYLNIKPETFSRLKHVAFRRKDVKRESSEVNGDLQD